MSFRQTTNVVFAERAAAFSCQGNDVLAVTAVIYTSVSAKPGADTIRRARRLREREREAARRNLLAPHPVQYARSPRQRQRQLQQQRRRRHRRESQQWSSLIIAHLTGG